MSSTRFLSPSLHIRNSENDQVVAVKKNLATLSTRKVLQDRSVNDNNVVRSAGPKVKAETVPKFQFDDNEEIDMRPLVDDELDTFYDILPKGMRLSMDIFFDDDVPVPTPPELNESDNGYYSENNDNTPYELQHVFTFDDNIQLPPVELDLLDI